MYVSIIIVCLWLAVWLYKSMTLYDYNKYDSECD